MKKIAILISTMILTTGFLFAQPDDNYRSRNHKLSKYNKSATAENKKQTVIAKSETSGEFENYLSRNSKFHKNKGEDKHVIKKNKIDKDYRARNHKLKNSQKNKIMSTPQQGELMTNN